MQITLKQPDIEAALKAYIANQGIRTADRDVLVSFTVGRKPAGITAEVSIRSAAGAVVVQPEKLLVRNPVQGIAPVDPLPPCVPNAAVALPCVEPAIPAEAELESTPVKPVEPVLFDQFVVPEEAVKPKISLFS